MEYKEKPEGPFFVSFYVTNFNSSDLSFSYKINIVDFYDNLYESNIINQNNFKQINFSNNYIQLNEEILVKTNISDDNNFVLIGYENIKAFSFLHEQLIISKNIIITYKYEDHKENVVNKNIDNEKTKKKKDNEKEGKNKKKKEKNKNNTKIEIEILENSIKKDIDINFNITLNINSLVGHYCDRLNYNIMNVKIDGIYNIASSIEEIVTKKNSLNFQMKLLDISLNNGILIEDKENKKYNITWNNNNIYKYRNIKEIEYIYKYLFYESFNINGWIICSNESKKQKDNVAPNIVDTLCSIFEVNISDIVLNKVVNAKYKLHHIKDLKKDIKNVKQSGNQCLDIFSNSYIQLTIQFYKPFLQRQMLESPFPIDSIRPNLKKEIQIENDKKKKEDISNLFNRSVVEGINFINDQIKQLRKEQQMKIYQRTKEYFSFLNNLKENPTYINLYNNMKDVMIKVTYDIINKQIYKHFNISDEICMDISSDNDNIIDKEKKIETSNLISEENINCIFVYLFNFMYESSNVIINNYFEKEDNINKESINDIKKYNNINNLEYYLYNIIIENVHLLKYKRNIPFIEAIILILYKKINNIYERNINEKNINDIFIEKGDNHIINIIDNYTCYNKNNTINDNYIYKKKEKKKKNLYSNSQENNITTLIKHICIDNRSNFNSYLFDYIEYFEDIILHKHVRKDDEEIFKRNNLQENILSVFNMEENKNIKIMFTDIIYMYSKVMLLKNNTINLKYDKQSQIIKYTEENEENKEKNYYDDNDNYNCQDNFDYYDKYINTNIVDTSISCLFTYIELTNSKNIESLFILCLLYLNIHKYKESLKLANYIINILQKRKENEAKIKVKVDDRLNDKLDDKLDDKLEDRIDVNVENLVEEKLKEDHLNINNLYIYSTFHDNHLNICENICIYIKSLCYFFQRNYIYYYINMCILLNENKNILKECIEKNANIYEEAKEKWCDLRKSNNKESKKKEKKDIEKDHKEKKKGSKKKIKDENNEKKDIQNEEIFMNDQKIDIQNEEIFMNDQKMDIQNEEIFMNDQKMDIQNEEIFRNDQKMDIQNEEIFRNDQKMDIQNEEIFMKDQKMDIPNDQSLNTYNNNNNSNINLYDNNNISRKKDKGKEISSPKNVKRKSEISSYDTDHLLLTYIETSEDKIPIKDKYMLLFIIYCIKYNIINIVMFIYENRRKLLNDITISSRLFHHLTIRIFFSIKDYLKCINLIEEKYEHLNNVDILYIYSQCLYKLKNYKKCIEYMEKYLNLCKYNNVRVKIYLQLNKIYFSLNKYSESKSMIKNSLQIYKTSYAYLNLAYYYLIKKKNFIYSYKMLYKANEINIFNIKLWAYLTVVFLHLNMKIQADKSLNNFLKMKVYKKDLIIHMMETYKYYGYEKEEKYLLSFLKN
ncbi:conserved Plasmodium protein, unknown function [Plasmodium sp. gorilla clade G2]|uniref:conserved Plasmodium protein, unknown function n=1 Tax=Plasmodium sp. gorilla clade G2 TaxID=880535 RepID=UPI000D1FEA82|nr:conserved Plasmodium protein, unknown function [Plasmodium sp. gorilla clade G2]SOV13723.1 conserved Plasmodium protein, unknown function [Plasmodium sp. gorilla clade G2]